MQEEIDVHFLEPTLAIAGINLEIVDASLFAQDTNSSKFSELINHLNYVDELEDLENLVDKFLSMKKIIEIKILKIEKVDKKFSLLCTLYRAMYAIELLQKTSFLFNHFEHVENLIHKNSIQTKEQIFEAYKIAIVQQIKDHYKLLLNDFGDLLNQNNEFSKIIDISSHENNFNDLKEADALLLELFKLDFSLLDERHLMILSILIKNDVLISLICLWNEEESIEDESWA